MILQKLFRRFAQNFTAHYGQDEVSKKIYCYVDREAADASSQQTVRIAPEQVLIKFKDDGDGRGYIDRIETNWRYQHLTNGGQVIKSMTASQPMTTNSKDLQDFFVKFGMPILMFMLNGLVRAIVWLGRNNYQPLFDGNAGTEYADSLYNTEVEGPGNYATHDKDGVSLDGLPENNADTSAWMAAQI